MTDHVWRAFNQFLSLHPVPPPITMEALAEEIVKRTGGRSTWSVARAIGCEIHRKGKKPADQNMDTMVMRAPEASPARFIILVWNTPEFTEEFLVANMVGHILWGFRQGGGGLTMSLSNPEGYKAREDWCDEFARALTGALKKLRGRG